jgi:valine--pyruvate aminotransferase
MIREVKAMHAVRFSAVGDLFDTDSPTRALMDDLGEVQRRPEAFLNLGGGNPARVPEVHAHFAARLAQLASERRLDSAFAGYEDPQGPLAFREQVAAYLARRQGWPVSADNILCTAGSQASFFMLFNLLAGDTAGGRRRQILFPQTPEYIGYSGLCLQPDCLRAVDSLTVDTGPARFRYAIDLGNLEIDPADTAAICLSRPTNPTGNICRDDELAILSERAAAAEVPLIVDCAYGEPFPGMMLSVNPLGASMASSLFEHNLLDRLVSETIRPFYRARLDFALKRCDEAFAGLDYRIHEPGGAIFLWVWFRDSRVDSQLLYERLKRRGVLVIPGHHFAPAGGAGVDGHLRQCLRLSFAQPEDVVARGVAVIGEEVRRILAPG